MADHRNCKDSRGEKNAYSHPSLAPTLHLQSLAFFRFCVLAPEEMNSIVFSKKKGEKSEDY